MEIDNVCEKSSRKTSKDSKKNKEEEENSEESEIESDYEPQHSEESDSGSSSGEESQAEVIAQKKKETSLKRKRSHVEKEKNKQSGNESERKKKKSTKRIKTDVQPEQPMPEGEKTFDTPSIAPNDDEKKTDVTTVKKPALSFGGHVDFNLHTEDPNNIITKTVQISNGLKMTCKMVNGAQVSSGKQSYPDWAALIFQKKIKDDKCFEFNVNLKDAPRIVEGINYMVEQNPKFFKN